MSRDRTFLGDILKRRRTRLEESRHTLDLDELKAAAHAARRSSASHQLRAALQTKEQFNIIAEFKRASPSKGLIRPDAEASAIATEYAAGGACAISVLTEEDFFRGSLHDLRAVRRSVTLPVLRKDFILDELQIMEAAAAGADAVLLIVRALGDDELRALRLFAEEELNMDALVEVHTAVEMQRALDCGATLIGVNNRNLDTFEVTLETSIELAAHAHSGVTLVSESGLRTRADIERLLACGYNGFLIGESLMRTESPAAALRELVGWNRVTANEEDATEHVR